MVQVWVVFFLTKFTNSQDNVTTKEFYSSYHKAYSSNFFKI